MIRKILFILLLVSALATTSISTVTAKKQQLPSFEKVFTPPYPGEGQWVYLFASPTQFYDAFFLSTASSVGGQIMRSVDGKTWASVANLSYGGVPYQNSWDMTIFKGDLYVLANSFYPPDPTYPGVIFRSPDGVDWEQIPIDTGNTSLDKIGEFNGMLYVTSVNGTDPENRGGLIWRSLSGDAGTWTVVQELEPGTQSSASPVAYKDRVYISGYAGDSQNIIIWSSGDGVNWDTQYIKITETSDDWIRDGMLAVYKGDLYLTTFNLFDGGSIYRTNDGKNWQLVLHISPVNGLYIVAYEDLIVYDGDLYAATLFYDENIYEVGEQIWRSHSGDPGTWEQITQNADWLTAWPERGAFGIFMGQLYVLDSEGPDPGLYLMQNR